MDPTAKRNEGPLHELSELASPNVQKIYQHYRREMRELSCEK